MGYDSSSRADSPQRGDSMWRMVLLFGCVLLSVSCATSRTIIPENLQPQITPNVSFSQVKESPSSHQGQVLVLAGEVLSSVRQQQHTRLTILQLPTMDYDQPVTDRTQSQGRFLAFQDEFLDPAVVPAGSRVTILGEVTGSSTELLDEMEYAYPTVSIKYLKVWPEASSMPPRYGRYGYPYYGPYPYGWGAPYWYGRPYVGLYRPYRYGFWW